MFLLIFSLFLNKVRILSENRSNFNFILSCLFGLSQEHLLNEANKTLKQRVYILKYKPWKSWWNKILESCKKKLWWKFFGLQLVEGYQVNALQLNQSADDMMYGRQQAQPPGDAFFHPLDCEPTLQIG